MNWRDLKKYHKQEVKKRREEKRVLSKTKEKEKIRGTSRARLKNRRKKTSNEIKFFFLLSFNATTTKNVFDLV